MFNSKFFTIMIGVTFLAVSIAITFQVLEMNEYNLFNTLLARFK